MLTKTLDVARQQRDTPTQVMNTYGFHQNVGEGNKSLNAIARVLAEQAAMPCSYMALLGVLYRVVARKRIIVGGASCPPYWLAKTSSHGWNNDRYYV